MRSMRRRAGWRRRGAMRRARPPTFGCYPVTQVRFNAAMSDRDDFLAWFNTTWRAAEAALHNGDAAPRFRTWSEREPVTLFGAWLNAFSPAAARDVFLKLAESFSQARSSDIDLIAADVSGDLAYTVHRELTSTGVNGRPRDYALRVTQIYRREDGEGRAPTRRQWTRTRRCALTRRIQVGPRGGTIGDSTYTEIWQQGSTNRRDRIRQRARKGKHLEQGRCTHCDHDRASRCPSYHSATTLTGVCAIVAESHPASAIDRSAPPAHYAFGPCPSQEGVTLSGGCRCLPRFTVHRVADALRPAGPLALKRGGDGRRRGCAVSRAPVLPSGGGPLRGHAGVDVPHMDAGLRTARSWQATCQGRSAHHLHSSARPVGAFRPVHWAGRGYVLGRVTEGRGTAATDSACP